MANISGAEISNVDGHILSDAELTRAQNTPEQNEQKAEAESEPSFISGSFLKTPYNDGSIDD